MQQKKELMKDVDTQVQSLIRKHSHVIIQYARTTELGLVYSEIV